ncbi:MAG: hypothetical protein GY791_08135 [Alphaproteobacteria bacterium]|nr:hypothetical protein [Alphaproteobacteria bacterium]
MINPTRAALVAAVIAVGGFAAGLSAPPAAAQQNAPAVIFESLMDSYFGDDDGYVSLGTYDLAFAPDGPAKALVGLVNANGDVLAQFPVYPDYKLREGVFARMQVVGPADIQLTEPGLYTLVFVFDGKPISRFPFLLKQTGDGADPYNPTKTYAFDGYWRTLAHITTGTYKDESIPLVTIWLGGPDMAAPDTFQDFFMATLTRDGALVAHSKRQTSNFGNGHFEPREVTLYQPHDEKQSPNAVPLTMTELLVDGEYRLAVTRASDDAPLRDFKFTVAGGKIQPLPRTQLGFDPATDFIVPRVTKKGSTAYEFVEAIWIGSE